jgi:putative thioredoxin
MSYEVRDFERDVIERSRSVPVVVDFWASWCGPCKMLGPVIEKLAGESGGRWDLVKVDTERHPDLATSFGISSIPAVKLFRDGTVVDEFLGFRPEAEIRRWLDPHLSSPAQARLEKAAELIDDGRLAEARTLVEEALTEEPGRAAARLLLAEILLQDEPARVPEILDGIPAEADERSHADALGLIARAAAQPEAALPEDALKPRLVAGLSALRRRDWDAALEAFVEVVERRRRYADGLAADAGKAIFRYLGIRHPIVDKHYRRFSGALNS